MGHIVLGAPGIDRFHLHARLAGSLRARGHRCTLVCTDAAARTFWRHQDPEVADLPPAPDGGAPVAPLAELARRDAAANERTVARLAALLPRLWHWFTAVRPDLVLLHQDRSADAGLLQFVARAAGCRVLWTGDGLLPHTLQLDEQGLDGDATCCRRSAGEYRVVRGDQELLNACLANALARTTPAALPRRDLKAPPLLARAADVPRVLRQRGLRAAIASMSAWRAARVPDPVDGGRPWSLPAMPFVAVLLQSACDPRLRLDAGDAPGADALIAAAARAAAALDRALPLVVVAPAGVARLPVRGPHAVVPAAAAMDAAATAVATITVNHPLAAIALLAGTPVVHTGNALYGVRGVATKAALDTLAPALRDAVDHDHPTLRQRVLTWLFGHGHVWCSGTHPDHNGMLGLVRAVEARLLAPPADVPVLRYRTGPAWPLAVDRRDA
jgi:hypothetical protein